MAKTHKSGYDGHHTASHGHEETPHEAHDGHMPADGMGEHTHFVGHEKIASGSVHTKHDAMRS